MKSGDMKRGGMKMNFPNLARWRLVLLAPLIVPLACESPRAPIRDQGRAFPDQQPEIVRDGGPVIFQPAGDFAATGRPGVHRVREGDTLYAIAFMYGIDYREVAAANNLSPPYTIYVDQELKLNADAAGSAAPTGGAASASAAAADSGIQRRPIDRRPSAPVSSGQSSFSSGSSAGGWQWPLAERGATNHRPDINNRLDIEARAGDSVRAAKDGEIVYSRPFGDEGSLLIIRHDDRYLSAYTQTGRVLVETGERVSAGQAIVELEPVDSGPSMVYFNVQRDGAFVDPTVLLP